MGTFTHLVMARCILFFFTIFSGWISLLSAALDIDCFSVPFHPVCRGAVSKRSGGSVVGQIHQVKELAHLMKRNDKKDSRDTLHHKKIRFKKEEKTSGG